MKEYILGEWLVPVFVVTSAFLLSFFVTFKVIMPVQNLFLPAFGAYASLLFLPHWVRVVTAWLYGWRSLLLLAPGSVLAHSYLFGSAGFSLDYVMAAFFGVFCAAVSFWFLALCGVECRQHTTSRDTNWRDVMLAGVLASVLNSLGTKIFYGTDFATSSAYFFGDVTGMAVSMFLMMMFFRIMRRANSGAISR